MPTEPVRMLDPRMNLHLQGFTGRAATTTIHDATETGISISGIFQAPEDFAVLGLYNAYDFFNHLRVKPLPRTDLSGLRLQFDLEYDHALEGAMRFDAAKYPSVAWDTVTFVCGKGMAPDDIYEVRLRDYATVIDGDVFDSWVRVGLATPLSFTELADVDRPGVDYIHLYFRDTRYTVTHIDARVETTIEDYDPVTGELTLADTALFPPGSLVVVEPGTPREEIVRLNPWPDFEHYSVVFSYAHEVGSAVRMIPGPDAMCRKLAEVINTPGEAVAGRYGPDQTATILASGGGTFDEAGISLSFRNLPPPDACYGALGNIDRIFMTSGHEGTGVGAFAWASDNARFHGGDNLRRYHIDLDFAAGLTDKLGRPVPVDDVRKIYMVFAPRFESTEGGLEDGCTLMSGVTELETVWALDDPSRLTGGVYFIGTPAGEERVQLVGVDAAASTVTVQRGYAGSTPQAWNAGARMMKLSPVSGFGADVEWRATISNLAVTGDRTLKVGGDAPRIEESDGRCQYTGYWEDYKYGGGFPTQWWSAGHAKRTAPNDPTDSRKVRINYSKGEVHDLYLGTFLNTDCGKISVAVDGVVTEHDLFLSEYGGTVANIPVRTGVAPGNHTVEITALFEKHDASTGYYFYFDYLWPLVPQDVPDAPQEYSDVSLAIDFDTDHGYKKPPAWHLWHLDKLGFKGHADVYMGVFWNNKRRRVGATYPYAEIAFSGTPAPGDVVYIDLAGTRVAHAIGYGGDGGAGETLEQIASQLRAAINGMFVGVWADNGFGASTTLRIQSKAPGYTFSIGVSEPNSVTLTLDDHLGVPGDEGDWELVDSVSPVMTEGARRWIRDLAGQFAAAGIKASFAFSMEVYNPPAAMRAKYLGSGGGVVQPGEDVFLDVPSHQMHFGQRVRAYLRQMYKECADEIAAAGLPVILQFGETQWWYFPNEAGMGFYDQETIDDFQSAKGHQIWPFTANTDDPSGDPAHPFETADFLRDRIWQYCQDVIAYVRSYHPAAVFECLWPLDANQGKPAPYAAFRRLLMHVNLPHQWKNSSYGIKYFRCEGFDYDVWQKNTVRMRQTITYPREVLGRLPEECMYLVGLYGPPDPPMAQAYGMWRTKGLYSFCFWAFDQFCLNSRPVPLEVASQAGATAAMYHKPRAARALEAVIATPAAPVGRGALNTRRFNE